MRVAGEPFEPAAQPAVIEAQLGDLTGELASLAIWGPATSLPGSFQTAYRFYTAHIRDRQHLICLKRSESRFSRDVVVTQFAQLKSVFGGEIVLAAPAIDLRFRRFLTSQAIGWIVPGEAAWLREFTSVDSLALKALSSARMLPRLSPTAQLVLFHHVLSANEYPLSAEQLSGPLRCSSMAIGRALEELSKTNLGDTVRRARLLHIKMGVEYDVLLKLSLPLLMSPVCSVHAVLASPSIRSLPKSGSAALVGDAAGHNSGLFSYAIHELLKVDFFRRHSIEEVDDAAAEAFIECWLYDPRSLTNGDSVDRLSLLAQFWNHPDPAISVAANDILAELGQARSMRTSASLEAS